MGRRSQTSEFDEADLDTAAVGRHDEEIQGVYKHIRMTERTAEILGSFRAGRPVEYQALLFIPSQAPFDLFQQTGKFGLHL